MNATPSPNPTIRKRPLISADAHAGAPEGELELVLARLRRSDGAAKPRRIMGPKGNTQKKEPALHPEDRIKDQDIDGVVAEVIYGSTGFFADEHFDDALKRIRATNDWTADVYGAHYDRFAPSFALPLPIEPYGGQPEPMDPNEEHIRAACDEIRRCSKLGLRPALMPDNLSKFPYNRPEWEPIWQTAVEMDMPLAFHVGFGHNPVQARGAGGAITNYVLVTSQILGTVTHLAASGVLERNPELRCVMVECGSGWLAWNMAFMDEAFEKHAHWVKPKLAMRPSEYVKRQIQVTFQVDPVGIANRHVTGLRCLMWGADYPHHEGTWPNSQEAVAKQFEGVPEDEIDRIVRRNAAETFGFEV
jgi:predicted TIM-barrel fold metal-dependent hydrolase